ncbi:MAG: branched-chain amino acid ABC transporter substrate-binding protein [Proteobacteria bacterium]|nr:branched-chain amino acid ABC transporter substrate-binding protein [Pseudomonadota bacterium]
MSILRSTASTLAVAAIAAIGLGGAIAAKADDHVKDPIGVVKLQKGEPIVIGFMGVLSGADTSLGLDELRGVQIAMEDWGEAIDGHPLRVIEEDSLCSAEGGQTAATKLAANQKVVAVAGPSCSSAAVPGAPILWKSGIPMVGISPTSPVLTAADRPADYDGFTRVVWNDSWAGKLTAEWAYNVAGAKTTVGIHDGSPYAEGLVQAYLDSFTALGGKVLGKEAVSPTDTDMRPVLTRVAASKPDLIFFPDFVQVIAHITRQAQSINGLENSILLTADGALVPQVIEMTGGAITKLNVTSNDLSPEALGANYPDFLKKYEAKFGEKPIAGFHHFGYDAAQIILMAVKKVMVVEEDGTAYIGRKALRDAILATSGYDGLTGTKTCNEHGDCGTFNYTVYQYTGTTDPYELGKNPKKVYPAN